MGKVRAKDRKRGGRHRPTGLPSVKESVQRERLETTEPQGAAILDQLCHSSYQEREWACRSLSHLVQEESTLKQLMKARLVRKTTPLLLDQVYSVREAAAGLLRNLSVISSEETCDALVKEDVMTPLSALLRDCLSKMEQVSRREEEGEKMAEAGGKDCPERSVKEKKSKHRERLKVDVEKQQLIQVLEQGLHLLWNISERSPLVVEVFNRESLLPLILTLLQPSLYPHSVVIVAAQLLHTVTEDNKAAIDQLCSSPNHLSHLESLLQEVPSDKAEDRASNILLRTCIAGVFQNLLSGFSSPLQSQTRRGVLATLLSVLKIDVPSLVTPSTASNGSLNVVGIKEENTGYAVEVKSEGASKDSTSKSESRSDDKNHSKETTLSAIQLALEILANVCYVEGDDDDNWEDEEMEEVIGERAEVSEMETESQAQVVNGRGDCDPEMLVIAELGIHEKVLKLCCMDIDSSLQVSDPNLHKCLGLIQSRSLIALQNLLTVLPMEQWGGVSGCGFIWKSLFTHCSHYCSDVSALCGALLALTEKTRDTGIDCLSVEQVQYLSQIGLVNDNTSVRANVMAIFGCLGKMVLKVKREGHAVLRTIGTTLRNSIANDISLWVVAQALDATFDLFGDDLCPPSLFESLSFLPVLTQVSSTIRARLRVEKKSLGEQIGLVHNAQANLPRFIEYMNDRCRT